jgi:hypothetical protein
MEDIKRPALVRDIIKHLATQPVVDEALKFSYYADKIRPPFLTDDFCDQHKRRLFTKAPELYPQFEKYGKNYENWYFLDGNIVKYVNGKRL